MTGSSPKKPRSGVKTLSMVPETCDLTGRPLPDRRASRGPRSPYVDECARRVAKALRLLEREIPRLVREVGFEPRRAAALRGDLWALAAQVPVRHARPAGKPTRQGVRLNPVRVPPDVEARLRELARAEGLSIAEAHRRALAGGLAELLEKPD